MSTSTMIYIVVTRDGERLEISGSLELLEVFVSSLNRTVPNSTGITSDQSYEEGELRDVE